VIVSAEKSKVQLQVLRLAPLRTGRCWRPDLFCCEI